MAAVKARSHSQICLLQVPLSFSKLKFENGGQVDLFKLAGLGAKLPMLSESGRS